MERSLDVYLLDKLVGHLVQDSHGQMLFRYAGGWLNDQATTPLSRSLPLRSEPFSRSECRGFFAGLLPEETPRDIIAENLGISKRNDFAMLEQIGGECAGAVTFLPAGAEPASLDCNYRLLSDHELAEILRSLPRRPLLAGDEGVRLSLAGAQNKLAVHISSGDISVPLGSAPSSHVLKPPIARFEGSVFNEAFCMTLACAIGLPVAPAQTRRVEEIDFLLVERYDRLSHEGQTSTQRLHQEDFCQALGIVPENKYQGEGGPSLARCFDLVREMSSAPVIDLRSLLDGVIFNGLIGNNDAHGKNFSLLYESGGSARLAPFYDLLSTAVYPDLSTKMAMKIGGESEWDRVSRHHFERLAEDADLAKPMVVRRVPEVAGLVLTKMDDLESVYPKASAVSELVHGRCERIVERFGG